MKWWKKENRGRKFTDEDREKALEVRNLNTEIRKLEKEKIMQEKRAEIAEMKEELKAYKRGLYDEGESGPEQFFMNMLMSKMMGGQIPQNAAQEQPQEQPQEELPEINLSDEEIDGIIKNMLPKRFKLLSKVLSEANLKAAIIRLDENELLNEENINKIVLRLKK